MERFNKYSECIMHLKYQLSNYLTLTELKNEFLQAECNMIQYKM